ncbi:MAG: sigma-70 family RNA polymerase sigma factor [Cyanobacteria bacterium J06632_3]
MRPRVNTVNIFSTFIQFADDRFSTWVRVPQLVRSMQRQLEQSGKALAALEQGRQDEALANFWVLYWFRRWQAKHPRAEAHLNAYLQESCYWAAANVAERFVSVQYSLADGFQTAIARTTQILKRYSPDYGSSLKGYAQTAYGNFLRDRLRQQKAIHICSDWGLLRKISKTQLKEGLLAAGYRKVGAYVLIWKCFNAVCVPSPHQSARGLKAPTQEQCSQIAARYNKLRTGLNPVPPTLEDAATVSMMLQQLVQSVRIYLSPRVTSLNQPLGDESGRELLNDLSGKPEETPMAKMLAAEAYAAQQKRQQQIGAVLLDEIAALDAPSQKLLALYYQQSLTQKEIATQLNIKQYQVSRKLSRIRQLLLLAVAKWTQENLHTSINSDVLANVNEAIQEWLQQHYATDTADRMPLLDVPSY